MFSFSFFFPLDIESNHGPGGNCIHSQPSRRPNSSSEPRQGTDKNHQWGAQSLTGVGHAMNLRTKLSMLSLLSVARGAAKAWRPFPRAICAKVAFRLFGSCDQSVNRPSNTA